VVRCGGPARGGLLCPQPRPSVVVVARTVWRASGAESEVDFVVWDDDTAQVR